MVVTLPLLSHDGFCPGPGRYSTMVRDFPIDYSILVENITESAPRLFRPSEVIRSLQP